MCEKGIFLSVSYHYSHNSEILMEISKFIVYRTDVTCPTLPSLYAMNILLFKKNTDLVCINQGFF